MKGSQKRSATLILNPIVTIFLFVTIFLPQTNSSAFHTITIDGSLSDWEVGDQSPGSTGTGANTWYFTWDNTAFYVGLNSSFPADSELMLYFDTDPRQNPMQGSGILAVSSPQ